jgi:hypothetical protein
MKEPHTNTSSTTPSSFPPPTGPSPTDTQTHPTNQKAATMQFTTTLLALLTLGATLHGASAAVWNDRLKVWDIGRVRAKPNDPYTPMTEVGPCNHVKEGGYGCGSFGPGHDVALRVIYNCQRGTLRRTETCKVNQKNNACVRNWRKKGRAFYPFEPADKVVCVQRKST